MKGVAFICYAFFISLKYYLNIMEIKFIKDHITSKKGDVLTVNEQLGNYLVRCKVAVKVTDAGEKPKTVKKHKAKK